MGVLSAAYDGSWSSIGFLELTPLSGASPKGLSTVEHLVGTNDNTEFITGTGVAEWSMSVGMESSQLASLDSKVEDSGTLIWHKGTTSGVRLMSFTWEKTPGFDAYKVQLNLRKTP